MSTRLAVIFLAVCAGACQGRPIDYGWIARADRGEVRSRKDAPIATIDKKRIEALAQILGQEKSGWEVPWYGTPVAKFAIVFFRGEERLGTIGVGESFLTIGPAQELSKDISAAKRDEILRAAGVAW